MDAGKALRKGSMRRRLATQRRLVPVLVLAAACAGHPASQTPAPAAQEYDLVIRNGRVLDGAGNPWVRADVAVRAGRIAKIGLVSGKGRREIDASGRYVSPGFI